MTIGAQLRGHYWTLAPVAMHGLSRGAELGDTWRGSVPEPRYGIVQLTGVMQGRSEVAFVLMHGLGGSPASHYLVKAERILQAQGFASLRLAQRGADRLGEDLHHAGLFEDLFHVIEHGLPDWVRYVFVLGFSMGGHVALRLAASPPRRLCGVAAVCTPLELASAVHYVDHKAPLYRDYLLHGLVEIYEAIAARGRGWTAATEVRAAKSLKEWDSLTVVRRFGFRDAEDYYARQSACHVLQSLAVPSLLVYATNDPVIRPHSIEPALRAASYASDLTVVSTEHGGHVGFPASLDLGLGKEPGLMSQLVSWCLREGAQNRGNNDTAASVVAPRKNI